MSDGAITVGDLTSLLLYTVYVGSGLQMLTSVHLSSVHSSEPHRSTHPLPLLLGRSS